MINPQPRRVSSGFRTVAILIAVIAALYLARDILIPLAFAVTLTLILSPAVNRLVKLHVRRAAAALIMVAFSIILAGGIGFVIFNQLIQVLNELPGYQEIFIIRPKRCERLLRVPSRAGYRECSGAWKGTVQHTAASRRAAPEYSRNPAECGAGARPAFGCADSRRTGQ
jgi:predicted PurR-regulated permease PerM